MAQEKKRELEALRDVAEEAFKKYFRDRRISEVKLEIERDYYSMAVQ